ncbi:MAG: glycosyltransferase family 2 protein [Planctomycetes bacterium]|nr:glycosyltransferase family 2 protein [Planctomycetota bacterium]
MGKAADVSVLMPAYNAGRTIESVVDRIPADAWARVKSLWVINDGSLDDTAAAAERVGRTRPGRVKVVNLPGNRGYGGAVKAGLERVREEGAGTAVCLHADGQYAPEEMMRLVDEMHRTGMDVLQGSRLANREGGGGAIAGGMPLYKYAAGRVLCVLENIVFRKRMTDYHSGYMVYGKRALEEIPFKGLSDSFDFDLEVIAAATAMGLSVGESPIPTHYGDEVSHLNTTMYGLRVLRVLARYGRGGYRKAVIERRIRR